MKRSGFTLAQLLIVLTGAALLAFIFVPVFARSRENAKKSSCPNNLKQVGLGLLQYAQDNDENLPRLAGGKIPRNGQFYGWADALLPYIKTTQLYQCPLQGQNSSGQARLVEYTDYWFNSKAAGLSLAESTKPAISIAIGEGNDGSDITNARYNLSALPSAWLNDQNSPSYRHSGQGSYCFLDGHVRAFTPDAITNEPVKNGKPTFAVW